MGKINSERFHKKMNGPWKDMKHGLDEKVDLLPRTAASDIFREDFSAKNNVSIETKFKHQKGTLKYTLTQDFQDKDKNLAYSTKDGVKFDVAWKDFFYRLESNNGRWTEQLDAGTFQSLDGA